MKVAAVQMTSTPNVAENLKEAGNLITRSADKGAKLVVLPEMFARIGGTTDELLNIQEPYGNGPIQSFLSLQAKNRQIWLVGGTIPISTTQHNKVRAATLVYDPSGNCVARYDKIHLYDANLSENESYKESATIEAGDKIVTATTPLGKLGFAVCYDVRFPELFRALATKNVEIICLPAAFTVKTGEAHWELLARARAVENFCFVIGACQGGHNSTLRSTYGHSIIINPWGEVIAKKSDDQPGIITAEIDLTEIVRVHNMIPALNHRRIS